MEIFLFFSGMLPNSLVLHLVFDIFLIFLIFYHASCLIYHFLVVLHTLEIILVVLF